MASGISKSISPQLTPGQKELLENDFIKMLNEIEQSINKEIIINSAATVSTVIETDFLCSSAANVANKKLHIHLMLLILVLRMIYLYV